MSRLRRASQDVVRVPASDLEVHAPLARAVRGGDGVQVPQIMVVQVPAQEQLRPVEAVREAPSSGVQVLALLVAVVAAFALGAYVLTPPPWQDDRPVVQQERER